MGTRTQVVFSFVDKVEEDGDRGPHSAVAQHDASKLSLNLVIRCDIALDGAEADGALQPDGPARARPIMSPPIDVAIVVAIVDPISTGASLAKFLSDRGYPLVRVFSDTLPDEVLSTRGSTPLASLARLLRGLSQRQIVPHAAPTLGRTVCIGRYPRSPRIRTDGARIPPRSPRR